MLDDETAPTHGAKILHRIETEAVLQVGHLFALMLESMYR